MTPTRHPLVEDYLVQLRNEATRLDPGDSRELLTDIEEHLNESVPPDASDAEARNALQRLGTPRELVEAALNAPGAAPAPTRAVNNRGSGAVEAAALFTLIGAELLAIFWFVALPLWLIGLVCLALARRWTPQLKLRGFLGLATGLPLAWLLVILAAVPTSHCTTTSSPASGDTSPADIQTQCTNSVSPVFGYVILALLAAYFVFQVLTVRKLARATRSA